MPKRKMRRLGNIMLDVEQLMFEMVDDHDLQVGEILSLIQGYLMVHTPGAIEEYEDGTRPVFYYGHEQDVPKPPKRGKR